MKKAKTQTGLVRGEPKGKTARMTDKPKKASNKKQAKQRKAAKLAEKKQKKQGGKGRPFRAKPWGDYAKGEKPFNAYTTDELRDINRRAAKAANSRLRALEKAGLISYAYKQAQKLTGAEVGEKPRFREKTKSMTRQELVSEFAALRDFMTAKTSTVTGYRETKQKVYESAVQMGFTGTDEELSFLFKKYMTEEMEKMLGSDIIYEEITSGRAASGSLQEMISQFQKNVQTEQAVAGDRSKGRALLESLRKYGRKS